MRWTMITGILLACTLTVSSGAASMVHAGKKAGEQVEQAQAAPEFVERSEAAQAAPEFVERSEAAQTAPEFVELSEAVQTEDPYDDLIGDTANTAVDALTTELPGGESVISYLSDDAEDILNSMDQEQIREYAVMIERLLANPDFQELLQYEEVRDLMVTLTRNALDFAAKEPDLTDQILETMGIDRRAVLVFYSILDVASGHKETAEVIGRFLVSEEGARTLKQIMAALDEETMKQLLDVFQEATGEQRD